MERPNELDSNIATTRNPIARMKYHELSLFCTATVVNSSLYRNSISNLQRYLFHNLNRTTLLRSSLCNMLTLLLDSLSKFVLSSIAAAVAMSSRSHPLSENYHFSFTCLHLVSFG